MFQCLSTEAPLSQMCGSSACCCLVNALGIGGFQAVLPCGLFFSASQLAAAGDVEAPQRQENQELPTGTCSIQASASESWQWHWTGRV